MSDDKEKKDDWVVLAKPVDRPIVLTKEGYERLTRPLTEEEKKEKEEFLEHCRKCYELFNRE